MKIQEPVENYLKAILMLAKEQPYAHSIDIATGLGFSRPDVSAVMKDLHQNGYVQIGDQGHITLTSSGQAITDAVCECHTLLSNWLICLGVGPRAAAEDVCRMERTPSAESFDAIKRHIIHGYELPDQEEAYA